MSQVNQESLFHDIAEYIAKAAYGSINYLKNSMGADEVIKAAWTEAMFSETEAAKQIREYYLVGNFKPEAMKRQRVVVLVKYWALNQSRILRRREELLKKNAELVIENTMSKPSTDVAVIHLLFGLSLSDEQKVLVLWKMDLLEEKTAMVKLSCSRATLFNRWNELKQNLKEIL
jgi:hypothetical protein